MKKEFVKYNKFLLFIVIPAFALITIFKFDWTALIATVLFILYAIRLYTLFDIEEIQAREWFSSLNIVDKKLVREKFEKSVGDGTVMR